jgi:hypothetical protein
VEVVSSSLTPRQLKYRRSPKPRALRTWRTRPDPFEAVWIEVSERLGERPELTAKSILSELQNRYPRQYPDSQLRTLQRRVKEWRTRALIQFDDDWLGEELLAGVTLPRPLRATTDAKRSVGGKPELPTEADVTFRMPYRDPADGQG